MAILVGASLSAPHQRDFISPVHDPDPSQFARATISGRSERGGAGDKSLPRSTVRLFARFALPWILQFDLNLINKPRVHVGQV